MVSVHLSPNYGSFLWILVRDLDSERSMPEVWVPPLRFYLLPLLFPLPEQLQYTLVHPTTNSRMVKGIIAPTILHLWIRTSLKAP